MKGAIGFVLMILSCVSTASAETVTFSWEVLERFRVIRGADEEARFNRDLSKYFRDAECRRWGDPTAIARCWNIPVYAQLTERNYPTYWNPPTAQYDIGWVHDRQRVISLSLATSARALSDITCEWIIDGLASALKHCRGVKANVELGRHRIVVRAASKDGQWSAKSSADIELKDVLIVSLGDSFASGEGNPHVHWRDRERGARDEPMDHREGRPAQWLDRRCHRSLISGPALAAKMLASENAKGSVTFLGYACSGAEVNEGLLKSYYGRETAEQVFKESKRLGTDMAAGQQPYPELLIPPQIDKAKEALCPLGQFDIAMKSCQVEPRKPDYLLISTGGNELRFGDMVREFVFNCSDGSCYEKLRAELRKDIDELRKEFVQLNTAIRTLESNITIISEYPDPTRNESKTFCDDRSLSSFFPLRGTFVPRGFNAFVGITAASSKFAHDEIMRPLNALIKDNATAFGWRLAPMMVASETKGYCSQRRWFHNSVEAYSKQGNIEEVEFVHPEDKRTIKMDSFSTGVMHPNVFGHNEYAKSLRKQM